ncbi:hypothetical protein M9H77_30848 [Catharanthus roseus]|uniref:Uncharacterized protein n=1 Tax=Catharanthus roseus TaxID=4058 RepID=A0ACB9ZZC9_CATRO|nr:hypothetical protein M9H77_30848 [Catharanthus roseus]
MPVPNSHPLHEVGYQGRPQFRGGRRRSLVGRRYHRPQEEFPRLEACHDDNYDDYGDNPNVGQAYHGGYNGNQQGIKALEKSSGRCLVSRVRVILMCFLIGKDK